MSAPRNSHSHSGFRDLPAAARLYVVLVGLLGWGALAYSIFQVFSGGHEVLPVLAGATVLMSCLGFRVPLPFLKAGGFAFTVSDCFVFMAMLLYGPAAAVCLGALDGVVGSLRFGIKSPYRVLFNVAGIALTAYVISHAYGLVASAMSGGQSRLVSTGTLATIGLSAIGYFAVSSLLVAVALGLTSGHSLVHLWGKYFPVTSPGTVMSVCAGLLFLIALEYTATSQLITIVVGATLLAASVSYSSWASGRLTSLAASQTP